MTCFVGKGIKEMDKFSALPSTVLIWKMLP